VKRPSSDSKESVTDINETPVFHDAAPDGDDSSDDDMELFISSPPERPQLAANHPYNHIIARLTESALEGFPLCVLTETSEKRARSTTSSPAHKRLKSTADAYIELEQVTDSEDEEIVCVASK
jgi:hypothetical protein